MPNVASVLKAEIARIARKEAKGAFTPVRRATARLRKDTAALKRRIVALERDMKGLQALVSKTAQAMPAPAPEEADKARITAKGIRSLRRRLKLSGEEFGLLLGITPQAVYNLEKGKGALRVRASTRTGLLTLRGIGAKEARESLQVMRKGAAERRNRSR
jgi:DNA-binding transcriptional regulator YiaG